MKKSVSFVLTAILLFFPILFSHTARGAGTDVVVFTDPAFEAAVRELIEKPSGDIIRSDLEYRYYLDVTGKNIKDLNGIEFFKDLNVLYCGGNQITELYLTRNLNLTEVICDNNRLTKLTLPDGLISLLCDYNQLTELEIPETLETLDCSNNLLTELTVPEKLSVLRCSRNQIAKLTMPKTSKLYELDISYNELSELDVSSAADKLLRISCSNNKLTSLDFSKNTMLYEIICPYNELTELDISNNPALITMFCQYNQLASVDLSSNTALETLNCINNQLTELDLSANPALTHLLCETNLLTELDLSANTNLFYVNCVDNYILSESDVTGFHQNFNMEMFIFSPQRTGELFNISATTSTGGIITPTGDTQVVKGSNKKFVITAFDGYYIHNVTVDSEPLGAVTEYTFSDIAQSHTIHAEFKKLEREAVYDGVTLHIPADSLEPVRFRFEGFTITGVFGSHTPGTLNTDADTVTIPPGMPAFNAILKLISEDGKSIRYTGIEKPVSVSGGTDFDGNTWIVPPGYTGDAIMSLKNWKISRVLTSEQNLALSHTETELRISQDAPFKAIIKLNSTSGAVKYIGVERK